MSERCQFAVPFGLMVMPSHAGEAGTKLKERVPVFADAGRRSASEEAPVPPRRAARPPAPLS